MITKVSIHNFRCLRDVCVDLARFTILVGPNASGKSSMLQALNHLCDRFHVDHPQNYDAVLELSRSRGAADQIEFAAETGGKAYRYRTPPASAQSPQVNAQDQWTGRETAGGITALDWKPWTAKRDWIPLPRSSLLRLEASNLVRPGGWAKDATVMSPKGEGLHSALANMALNDPDSWHALQDSLRRIIPSIYRLRHTKSNNMQQPALLFDTVGADSVPADQVSEGTLLVLGLLAALHAAERPNLILLDDLDRGLHPKAQKELIELLRGLLDTNPDLQLVATTHSPYMLDCMEVDEVRMTFLNDEGATICAPLTTHPNYPTWKDEMTPGEMWSLFGEKWLVEEVSA